MDKVLPAESRQSVALRLSLPPQCLASGVPLRKFQAKPSERRRDACHSCCRIRAAQLVKVRGLHGVTCLCFARQNAQSVRQQSESQIHVVCTVRQTMCVLLRRVLRQAMEHFRSFWLVPHPIFNCRQLTFCSLSPFTAHFRCTRRIILFAQSPTI